MSQAVQQILATANKLQPFPQVAQKALALLDDPDVGVNKLVEVIELDANLTATVLRAVNSAHYALRQRVDNVRQALAYLGNKPFRELVFASASAQFMTSGQLGYDMSPGDLWRHSIAVSLMTQVISERVSWKPGPALFTAALLHDIGKSVLTTFVQKEAQQILAMVKESGTFLEAEKAVLGMDHAELGGRIVENWRFSPQMVELIRFHHDPEGRPENTEVAILYLSNVLCQLYGLGSGVDGLHQKGHSSVLERLKLKQRDLEAALAELHVRLGKAEALLGLVPLKR